ncbi:MAG: hypothetical protein KIS90_07505, partial [Phenylobacterium sp.]|nr:hypothetical protein [Phenylobacterium sp.]
GANSVDGGGGADTIVCGSGNDTITGGAGADLFTGGGGSNLYVIGAGDTGITEAAADRVTDFTSADSFDFGQGAGSGANYFEGAAGGANDFAAALAAADTALDGTVIYAAISYAGGVALFVDLDADGSADQAILLVGRALTNISEANIV